MREWLHWQAKTCVFCLLRLPLSNERRCGNGQGLSWHTPGLKGPQEDEGGDGLHKANSDYLASGSSQAHRHSSCTELESVAANEIYLLHGTDALQHSIYCTSRIWLPCRGQGLVSCVNARTLRIVLRGCNEQEEQKTPDNDIVSCCVWASIHGIGTFENTLAATKNQCAVRVPPLIKKGRQNAGSLRVDFAVERKDNSCLRVQYTCDSFLCIVNHTVTFPHRLDRHWLIAAISGFQCHISAAITGLSPQSLAYRRNQ